MGDLIVITGPSRAIEAANWLKKRGWNYTVQVANNSPFSGVYHFQLNNKEQEMLFRLTWPY
jgi:hypothetical protein